MQQAMSVPDPIAAYNPTGHTNEDMAEYPVLTDLTGNGHDITLNNFAWSGMSGIGGYYLNFNNWSSDNSSIFDIERYSNKVIFTNIDNLPGIQINLYRTQNLDAINGIKFKVSGMEDGERFSVVYKKPSGGDSYINVTNIYSDGEVTANIPASSIILISINNIKNKSNRRITIEQLPLYGNALVSDGVDDYGICDNFPILTKEKGYTVVAVRKILNTIDVNSCFINQGDASDWSFATNLFFSNYNTVRNWGSNTRVGADKPYDLFVYQNSKTYNGIKDLTIGDKEGLSQKLNLFSLNSGYLPMSAVLYSLEIYDRDLTPYQIEVVKKRLMDKYNNPEDTTSDWYGVEWYTNQSPSRVMRIGNVNMHKSLPIQSGMYRCILNDNGEEVYKLDPNDSTKKEDGTAAVLDGTDGQVMVYIPVFYARFESKGYRRRVKLSDHYKPGFIKMGGCYISAYEATIDRTTSGTPKLASVVNETANFRGGNNNAEWDDTYRSLLGMPATTTSLTNFRTYARNRKADNMEWNCMDYHAYKALYWLYVVEYANRNCQLDFNDALTSEGFRQGGLGAGVTNINGTKWYTFNGYYPFIKCGYTNSLGNKTGIVAFTMPDEYDAETPLTTYVPSYRGVENLFGHIWKWTDGLHIRIQSEESGGRSILYTADNPASYQDSNYDGYDEIGDIARTEGYVKDILFDDGEMLPTVTTGSSSTKDFSDYFYTNIPASGEALRGVLFGGHAYYGANVGFASADTNNAPSRTISNFGSRLCYIPNN